MCSQITLPFTTPQAAYPCCTIPHLLTSPPHADEWFIRQSDSKLETRKHKHTQRVRDKVFKAIHSVVDKAKVIVGENLSSTIKSKVFYSKNQKRRLSGWVRGTIKEALEHVSQRRGSSLIFVNASYTSQTDSRFGVLLGHRDGETFYCFDGVVLDVDENAARNILARKEDPEIRLWTPFQQVKSILLKRTELFKVETLRKHSAFDGWDCSSKTPVAV